MKSTGHSAEQQYVHLHSALWFFEWIVGDPETIKASGRLLPEDGG